MLRGTLCSMAPRLSNLWLALVLVLGQWMPLQDAVASASMSREPASTCCAGVCCCGDPDICPCIGAPPATPLPDETPAAPAPTRDADQFRATLDAARLAVAHPAPQRAQAPRLRRDHAPARDPSISVQSLHSVWLI